jgi:hypothetical protein
VELCLRACHQSGDAYRPDENGEEDAPAVSERRDGGHSTTTPYSQDGPSRSRVVQPDVQSRARGRAAVFHGRALEPHWRPACRLTSAPNGWRVQRGDGQRPPTNDNTELCYECLLPWIPQLCELDVLEDWGRVHQLHFPSKGGKSRHTTTHNGIQIDCIEDYVVRALGTAQRPFLRRPLMWEVVANHGSVDPEPFKRLHPSLEPALSPLT